MLHQLGVVEQEGLLLVTKFELSVHECPYTFILLQKIFFFKKSVDTLRKALIISSFLLFDSSSSASLFSRYLVISENNYVMYLSKTVTVLSACSLFIRSC